MKMRIIKESQFKDKMKKKKGINYYLRDIEA